MITEIQSVSYCAIVTEQEFRDIMDLDSHFENESEWSKTLVYVLDDMDGVDNVDYNGHFGANVFFTVEGHPKAHKDTVQAIAKTIGGYIETWNAMKK